MDKDFADSSVVSSDEWKRSMEDGEVDSEIDNRLMAGDEERGDGGLAVHSLSGKERNHLFLNADSGREFDDVSALSGMDSASDARVFVLFDYDHDGWQDVAVVNANQPLTQLFHNDINQIPGANAKGGMIAIRFVGGNTTASASDFSNRDGYGAMVEVTLGDGKKLVREHRCGEGYAAQNSATMIVGIGAAEKVATVRVRWPSGRAATLADVGEGMLVTAFENRAEGNFTQKVYRDSRERMAVPGAPGAKFPVAQAAAAKVHVYTTTATWCAACLNHLPALENLRGDGIALFGVPVDPTDDVAKLGKYVEEKKPAYTMLAEMDAGQKSAVSEFLSQQMGVENPVLPSSVITDADGVVLEVVKGIPSLSQVRKWMHENHR